MNKIVQSLKKSKIKRAIILGTLIILCSLFSYSKDISISKISTFSKKYETPANSAFTDQNFYNCVVDAYNKENKTSLPYTTNLSDEQLQTVKSLDCRGATIDESEKISNIEGIEKLSNLTNLALTDHVLTDVDLTKNVSLRYLDLKRNQLTSINLETNINLIELSLSNNQLKNLDLTKHRILSRLFVKDNLLTNIELSGCPNLEYIELGHNELTELNIENNLKLQNLRANGNKLTTLNTTKNAELLNIVVEGNELVSIKADNNTKLTVLTANNNKLQNLSIVNTPSLLRLDLENNELSNLDISGNPNIRQMDIYNNKLESINLGTTTALNTLKIYNNNLKVLNVPTAPYLSEISAGNNRIEILTIDDAPNLKLLGLYNNQLKKFDLCVLPLLTVLNLSQNQLTTFDMAFFPVLEDLSLDSNQLTTINLNNMNELKSVSIQNNQLTSLYLKNNINLTSLWANNNKLTSIDLSEATALIDLKLNNNELTMLDLSNNTNLNLKTLDLLHNDFNIIKILYVGSIYEIKPVVILPNESQFSILSNINYGTNYFVYIDVDDDGIITAKRKGELSISNIRQLAYESNGTSIKSQFVRETTTLYIVDVISDKYIINNDKDFIYTGTDVDEKVILNNLSINYGTIEIENNHVLVKYDNEILKTYDLINVTSDVYDLTKDYINTKTKDFDISKIETNNVEFIQEGDALKATYNGILLKEYALIQYKSDIYDLNKDYIYTGSNKIEVKKIKKTNVNIFVENDILEIKYLGEVLESYPIISVESDKYDLTKDYIYIGTDEFNLDEVSVVNGTKEIVDNQLVMKYNDKVLKTFDLLSIDFGSLEVGNHMILLTGEMPYSDFVNHITTRGIIYKIYNGEDTETTSGNITKGMTLKVYYNDKVLDTYEITDEYLEFDPSLNVDEENHLFMKVKEGTKVSEIVNLISTSGTISKLDKNDHELTDEEIVKTGDKIKIELSKETFIYTISVFGDVTGDGIVNIADVGKLYKHVRKTSVMGEACELYAGDIVEGNDIIIADVGKLYKYVRKVITEL